MSKKVNIFWFRRDLRLDDNIGLLNALQSKHPVLPIFIFDKEILHKLPKDDARVTFIFETLQNMRNILQEKYGSSIALYFGTPKSVFLEITTNFEVDCVFANRDYEPYAKKRDLEIGKLLSQQDIQLRTYKDQVIFEKDEVVKKDGNPYVVFTPYKNTWKENFNKDKLKIHHTDDDLSNMYQNPHLPNLSLVDMGFELSSQRISNYTITPALIEGYEDNRDFPAQDGTSRLGPHLRFGTVSVRKMIKKAIAQKNEVFWSELIWREFFMQILWHFPHTAKASFKTKYDNIEWRNNEDEFKAWCKGETGYPLVDAGMRELNETGFMHNRVRMLVGSFLCKHLLIDWRWGEAYFAEKLHDYDMSSNVGNWQWVAGSGVDAAPYFRIFNPTTQIKKFDKDFKYIKKWVPEFQEITYTTAIVDHKFARERCLETYKKALN